MNFPSPFYRWRPHPWHGLTVGPSAPDIVHAYIEVTPFDAVKYEIDKETGYLRVDRPQRTSALPPCLYGFIPRTFCGDRVGALTPGAERGDQDPLDICVLSERPINRSEVVLNARVVGVLRMIDGHEADDKIISVLANDTVWSHATNTDDIPEAILERIHHYFQTYKMRGQKNEIRIEGFESAELARAIVEASRQDYDEFFGTGL
ncbi:MAG: inorganic pyrophosphatase [Myxococcota bacterium]|nr:inorganic pyrophosphatase [Myxococcota bacterium]